MATRNEVDPATDPSFGDQPRMQAAHRRAQPVVLRFVTSFCLDRGNEAVSHLGQKPQSSTREGEAGLRNKLACDSSAVYIYRHGNKASQPASIAKLIV